MYIVIRQIADGRSFPWELISVCWLSLFFDVIFDFCLITYKFVYLLFS